jgi:electron transport complex protein RnfB
MTILMAAIVLFGLTLAFATLLGVAKEKLRVDEDPRIAEINDVLPAANCGGCGYAGCADFAKAVVEQRAPCSGCPVGGSETANRIAEILGVEVVETAPFKAIIKCGAKTSDKLGVTRYEGVASCVEANVVGTTQACVYGCLGYGDCAASCDFDALHMEEGKPVVTYENCTGCGACVKACPRDLIELIPFKQDRMLVVACNNREPTKAVKAVCKVGCIGCKLCQRFAPDAFEVKDDVAHIKYDSYTGEETEEIKKVLDKCPAEVLVYLGQPTETEKAAAELADATAR